jgi:hypothetical protein
MHATSWQRVQRVERAGTHADVDDLVVVLVVRQVAGVGVEARVAAVVGAGRRGRAGPAEGLLDELGAADGGRGGGAGRRGQPALIYCGKVLLSSMFLFQ